MDASTLLQQLRERGYRLEALAGKVVCIGRQRAPEDLRTAIREHRDELLGLLDQADAAQTRDDPPTNKFNESAPIDCYCCTGTRWWRLPAEGPWVCARCHPSDRPDGELEWSQRRAGPSPLPGDPPAESRSSRDRAREGAGDHGQPLDNLGQARAEDVHAETGSGAVQGPTLDKLDRLDKSAQTTLGSAEVQSHPPEPGAHDAPDAKPGTSPSGPSRFDYDPADAADDERGAGRRRSDDEEGGLFPGEPDEERP